MKQVTLAFDIFDNLHIVGGNNIKGQAGVIVPHV